ncbi:MAG: hypothetical protein IK009_00345 [Bacteroidales bacterium]|nr:hypothetical protein [Bacteroidales bacterium]
MKKYFVLAAAALVALTACTKMEVANTPDTLKKISFEVANYSVQTKADYQDGGLLKEGYNQFNTYAWYIPSSGSAQTFMNNELIKYKTDFWGADDDYFWPKTGYVNFFSYAGTGTPTYSDNGATVTYSNKTITSADNYLLADAAYRYTANVTSSTNGDAYGKDGITEGVPTMFRHLLSRVNFTVKLATAAANESANTTWVVEILNADTKLSNIVVKKTGTLVMKAADPGSKGTVQYAPEAESAYATAYRWVAATGESTTETVSFLTPTMTMDVDTHETTAVSLLDERTMMPQLTNAIDFTLNYKVTAKHGDVAFMEENLTVTKKLDQLVSTALASWNMNTKITYNVIIDPVTQKVRFDPAVESWSSETARDINVPVSE